MIEAQDASLQYPDETIALRPFSLSIGTGELIYITGPSGSGKTSLLQLLLGMVEPTGGTLSVLNLPMVGAHGADVRKLRRRIGPVFQDFRLTAGRSARENVMAGMRFLRSASGPLKQEADAALEQVGLGHKAASPIEHLSWGERQRVAIARAIARKAELILADEPTGTLDRENALGILSLLTSMRNERTTVLITTHATHLLDTAQASGIIRMDNGQLELSRGGAVR
jgi:cell division transport system ATP-binding protein